MAKKLDRRVARTQTALRNAFLQLLRRRSYDSISVEDIVAEADIGRSTFYSHCSGKDQLLRLSLAAMRRELVDAQSIARARTQAPRFAFALPIFEHVAAHRALYPHVMRGRAAAIFTAEMRRTVLELVRSDLAGRKAADDFAAHFVVGAFMEILSWWVERRPALSPSEIDGLFQSLAGDGVPAIRP